MEISNAKYMQYEGENTCINATIDGKELSIPLMEGNYIYDEIMRQVDAGTLTIADVD